MIRTPLRAAIVRSAGPLALACIVAAYAFMGQAVDGGSRSHYALVKSLAAGTANVDETRLQVGDQPPSDVVVHEGHYYSNKAPGLALLAVPLYLVLDAAGVRTTGDSSRMIWALGLLGNVLPAAILLVLVRSAAERLEPGLGTSTAATFGLGTLILPFASTFYAHLLVAMLLFAAFSLLWRERSAGPSGRTLLVAGVLVGLAVTAEYPAAIAGAVLGAYALIRSGCGFPAVARRGAAYAAGIGAGLVPLLAYDWWAFGSPFHLSYLGEPPPGGSETGTVEGGLGVPSFTTAVELLFSRWGIVIATPVVVVAVLGTILLYRRGRRAEALVVFAVAALTLALNSSLAWPFGGTAGTRYLITILPFLTLGLALAFRLLPMTTAVLGTISITTMVVLSATKPLIAWDGKVLERLFSQDGSAETLADFVGITGWYAIVPFYALVVAALVCVVVATRLRLRRIEVPAAAAAAAGWLVLLLAAPDLLARGDAAPLGPLLVLVLFSAVAATVAFLLVIGPGRATPGVARRKSVAARG